MSESKKEGSSLPYVSILIVGYKSEAYIERCLSSIPRKAFEKIQLVFINNSNDNAESKVLDTWPDAVVVPSRGNIGFGAAVNLLSGYALAPYFLLLNPDAYLKGEALQCLLKSAERNPDCGAFGGLAQTPLGEFDDASIQALLTPFQLIRMLFACQKKISYSNALNVEELEATVLSGAFMLVPRVVWEEVGGFDSKFFLYAEEHDLCRRISQTGRRLLIVTSSIVCHDTGGGGRRNPERIMMRAKGNATYFRKHYGSLVSRLCLFLIFLHGASRYLAGVLSGKSTLSTAYRMVALSPKSWLSGWTSS